MKTKRFIFHFVSTPDERMPRGGRRDGSPPITPYHKFNERTSVLKPVRAGDRPAAFSARIQHISKPYECCVLTTDNQHSFQRIPA